MNAYELAKELSGFMTEDEYTDLDKTIFKTCNTLRQQANEIGSLKARLKQLAEEIGCYKIELELHKAMIQDLEKGLESSLNLNKAQSQRQIKELSDEEITEVLNDENIAEYHQGNWLVLPYAFARAILRKAQEK